MAYNPYSIATTQRGLLENLLGAEQLKKKQKEKVSAHKGKMQEDFEKELARAQKEQEAELAKRRKKKSWEKLLPIAGMFMGPLGSALVSGLTSMYGMGREQKHARSQIGKARALGLDKKWGGTFLGSKQRAISSEMDRNLDEMYRQTGLGGLDVLKTGLTSGITGWASGKIGEGITDAFKGLKSGDVLTGKQAKLLKSAEKSGFGDISFQDAEGLGIDPKFGDITKSDLSKLSPKDANIIYDLMDEGGGLGLYGGGMDTAEELVSVISGLQGKPTFLKSLLGSAALGKDPSTLLAEGGEGANVLQNLLLMLSATGGK